MLILLQLVFFFIFVQSSERPKSHTSTKDIYEIKPKAQYLPECPNEDRGYTHIEIEKSSYENGNYYGCGIKFKNKISINGGLLLLYNCNFTDTSSTQGAINIISNPETIQQSIEIHSCFFYQIRYEAIHIEAKEANIIECLFERCLPSTSVETTASAIFLKVQTGKIEKCTFMNNGENDGTKADVYYENYNGDGKVTFQENFFKRSGGTSADSNFIIEFTSSSVFDFIKNEVSVSTNVANVKLFKWPSDLTSIEKYNFEGNIMFPMNSACLSAPNGLLNGKFTEKVDYECPPSSVGDAAVQVFCGSPFDNQQQAFDVNSNLVNIIYCTFHNFQNTMTNKGGAIYIYIDKSMPTYDEPIRIYNSDFTYCDAKFGQCIYIESYQNLLMFDFRDCYFGENEYYQDDSSKNNFKGGAIFIQTKFSSFEFTRCSFDKNTCGDGAAIYFNSDTSDSLETEEKSCDKCDYTLHLTDCKFNNNFAQANGGALFISITGREHLKPILIENCIFYKNFADEADPSSESGGAIYYHNSYTKLVSSTSDYSLRIINCDLERNVANYIGGAICLKIQNIEPSKTIEITDCIFQRNYLGNNACIDENICNSGSDVYFWFDSSSSETSTSTHILNIKDSYIARSSIVYSSGSITILILNREPSKSIEINSCTFQSCKSKIGGCINYDFQPKSNDEITGENIYALNVVDCTFTSNVVEDRGGAIAINIVNKEPSNPIEINGCKFNKNKAKDDDVDNECGGAIYYSQKASSYSSKYKFTIINCEFNENEVSYFGGAICIQLTNPSLSSHIEINNCSFDKNSATVNDNGVGSSIYYEILSDTITPSTLLEDIVSLSVKNSNFTGGSATYSAEVYVETQPGQIKRTIEFYKCMLKDSKPEGFYLLTHGNNTYFHFNDCDFSSSSTIFFDSDVVAWAKLEYCRFNNMSAKPISYYSGTSSEISNDHELRIEHCEFIQDADIDCLVYFLTPVSSIFTFNFNNITINNENTRALGCKEEIVFLDQSWHFESNAITPGKEDYIKTDLAKLKIPASCQNGFICDVVLPECNDQIRCNFDSTIDGEQRPSVNLSNLHFKNNKYEENGASIYVYNYGIYCHDSTFTNSTSVGHGGGGIYIYLDKVIDSPIRLEYLEFTGCQAVYGGAVYVYSEKEENEITILSCTFNENIADRKPSTAGDVYYDGAAVYMSSVNGDVINCTFTKNIGSGLKIFSDFDKIKQYKRSLKSESSILITGCEFESDEDSKSSLYYVRGSKMEVPVEVKDCIFKGQTSKGSYHIDGESLSKKNYPMNLHISSCKFPDGKDSAINLKSSAILLESSEKVEQKRNNISDSSNYGIGITSLIFVAILCIAVIAAFFTYSKMKKKQQIDIEDKFEL